MEAKIEGFGGTFVMISVVMTFIVTILAVVAVSKLYYSTTPTTSFDRLGRIMGGSEDGGTLPSYSDQVQIDLETDEI